LRVSLSCWHTIPHPTETGDIFSNIYECKAQYSERKKEEKEWRDMMVADMVRTTKGGEGGTGGLVFRACLLLGGGGTKVKHAMLARFTSAIYEQLSELQKKIQACVIEFDVHGSVHLGNIYVQFKVQLDVLFNVFSILLYS
jgi:hypothetical protein